MAEIVRGGGGALSLAREGDAVVGFLVASRRRADERHGFHADLVTYRKPL